jgi:phospholipid transport system transporter-binding protein
MTHIAQIDHRWEVSGDVLIGTVSEMLAMSKALAMTSDTVIDFAKVDDIDTSTISLILEWKRRAQQENQQLKFVNLPANLTSLTQLYGVDELINA